MWLFFLNWEYEYSNIWLLILLCGVKKKKRWGRCKYKILLFFYHLDDIDIRFTRNVSIVKFCRVNRSCMKVVIQMIIKNDLKTDINKLFCVKSFSEKQELKNKSSYSTNSALNERTAFPPPWAPPAVSGPRESWWKMFVCSTQQELCFHWALAPCAGRKDPPAS